MHCLIPLVATLVVLAGSSARAMPILVDDFNDGSTDGWTTIEGTLFEDGGLFSGTGTNDDPPLATMDGLEATGIGVDAVIDVNNAYVALVLNLSSAEDNLFVKIQDDNTNGLFDSIYFYHGNNGVNALVGKSRFALSSEVDATYFQVVDHGDGTVSARIAATGDTFGGTLKNAYTGTGVGLGFVGTQTGGGYADNFYVLPEPGTFTLVALGMLALGWWRRS